MDAALNGHNAALNGYTPTVTSPDVEEIEPLFSW
jgi:hypothetical protein